MDKNISIHAPRERCDRHISTTSRCFQNFNPRTPREVRLSLSEYAKMHGNFNPRTPREVRLHFTDEITLIAYDFNPRTPREVRQRNSPLRA